MADLTVTVDQIRDMLSDSLVADGNCEYVTIHIDDSQDNSKLALVHGGGEVWLVTVQPAFFTVTQPASVEMPA